MAAAAAVLIVIGIIAMLASIYLKMQAKRITKTPFLKSGEAAQQGPGGAVSVEGNVLCPQPLVAPYSGTPCLYYDISVTAEWKQGDTVKRKELKRDKLAARFAIDDGTGAVGVDASKGGSFPTQTKSETKSTGLVAGITGGDLTFGNYTVSTGVLSVGTKYTVREEILTLHPRLYVNGASAGGYIATPSGIMTQLLISEETRDGLLASSLKNAKLSLFGGLGGLGVGLILAVVNGLMSPKAEAATPVPSASASAVAALPSTAGSAAASASSGEHGAKPEPAAHTHAAAGAKPAAGAGAKPAGAAAPAPAAAGAKPAAPAAAGSKPAAAKPAGAK